MIIIYGIPNSGHHLVNNILFWMGVQYRTFTHPYWWSVNFDKVVKEHQDVKVIVPIRDWYTLGIAAINKHKPYYDKYACTTEIEDDIHLIIEELYRKIFDDIYTHNLPYILFPTSALFKDKKKVLKIIEKFVGIKFPEHKLAEINNPDEKYY